MMYARKYLGGAPMQGLKHTLETKNKMSNAAKKRCLDKPHTIPDWTDRTHSRETRLNYLRYRGW